MIFLGEFFDFLLHTSFKMFFLSGSIEPKQHRRFPGVVGRERWWDEGGLARLGFGIRATDDNQRSSQENAHM